MSAHTPGPWKTYGPNVEGGVGIEHRRIAVVDLKGDVWSEEERANAKMIAAAPAMYEVLCAIALDAASNVDPGIMARLALALNAAEGR